VRRSAAPPWSLASARHGCGHPNHHASVACWWASGSLVSGPRSKWPGCKKVPRLFSISENCRNYLKLAKIIGNYLFVRKMQMTYQNAQKNVTCLC
jgi:hypothetical protein